MLHFLVMFIVQEIRELDGSQAELDDIGSLVRSRIAQLREQIEEMKRLAQVSVASIECCLVMSGSNYWELNPFLFLLQSLSLWTAET